MTRLAAALASLSSRLNQWMDHRRLVLLSIFSILLFSSLIARAAATPFWHDEIYTVLASHLSWPQLWRGHLDGLDLMPPLNTALTHLVYLLVGSGEVVSRVPPLLAVVAASVLIYSIVRDRTNALTAWSASLLFCFTPATRYAFEARSYGLTIFAFAVALFAWSQAARGHRRHRNLVFIALGLTIGVWAHYYAVLAVLPIVVGEVARCVRTRRLDRGVVLSLGAFALMSLPLYQLIASSMTNVDTFWSRLLPPTIREVHAFVLGTAGGSRFRAAALVVAVTALVGRWWWRQPGPDRNLPGYEVLAGLACLAIPVAGVLLGATVAHGVFVERYVLLATVGIAVVVPVVIWRIGPKNGLAELVLFAFLAVMFARMNVQTVEPGRLVFRDPFLARPILGQQLSLESGPIVVTGGVNYLPLWYYAPTDVRARMIYLADPAAELEHTGTAAIDDGYLGLERHVQVAVERFDTFVTGHRRFKLYALEPTWILARLRALGAVMHEEGRETDAVIYTVELPTNR